MHAPWFTALSMFVAINTVLYLTLAIIKLLPKVYLSDLVHQRNRRSETRSIYPDRGQDSSVTGTRPHLASSTPHPRRSVVIRTRGASSRSDPKSR
jgi:hypothetical protein